MGEAASGAGVSGLQKPMLEPAPRTGSASPADKKSRRDVVDDIRHLHEEAAPINALNPSASSDPCHSIDMGRPPETGSQGEAALQIAPKLQGLGVFLH